MFITDFMKHYESIIKLYECVRKAIYNRKVLPHISYQYCLNQNMEINRTVSLTVLGIFQRQ